mgnify:CR=1
MTLEEIKAWLTVPREHYGESSAEDIVRDLYGRCERAQRAMERVHNKFGLMTVAEEYRFLRREIDALERGKERSHES